MRSDSNTVGTTSVEVPRSAEVVDSEPQTAKAPYSMEYKQSVEDPVSFWDEAAYALSWEVFPKTVTCGGFTREYHVEWFPDGVLNVCNNCVDRHLETRGNQPAIIWEPDNPNEPHRTISYNELYDQVNVYARILQAQGVHKGDRVCIYMPMVPETAFAMLACARVGAIHSVVLGGVSSKALRERIQDADCKVVVTADGAFRAGKEKPLKKNVDDALRDSSDVQTVLVLQNTGTTCHMEPDRDLWIHDLETAAQGLCEPEPMNAEDPLFILYTSGSTGKPKGLVHTSGGYLLYALETFRRVFDYRDGERFWCTADVGWITGHTYGLYGALAAGATTVMFEGVPTYPDASRSWEVVEKHKVNIFYTAPTLIRSLMKEGEEHLRRADRSSLRVLGSVGEPINPEAWEWYHGVVGEGRCPVVDTYWQTETGGHLLTPLAGETKLKPGSATFPFFGVVPAILDKNGLELTGTCEGNLVIKQPWPGMARTIYGDHARFVETYFSVHPGVYFTGDGAKRDDDGYYWVTGRVDDVLNVSGHRLGTAEIESALVLHPAVAEAAVVGYPHDIKGQGIYAYVTLMNGVEATEALQAELVKHVRTEMGPIVTIDFVQWAPGLPKTRSGKIMRRLLRKIAANDVAELGDLSTLADPDVVESLTSNRVRT